MAYVSRDRIDEYIDTDLGGLPGRYYAFNNNFRAWLETAKNIDLSSGAAGLLLQEHKRFMSSSKYKLDCRERGPWATWIVCTPADAHASIKAKLDRYTMDLCRDLMWRAVNIAKADPVIRKKTETEIIGLVAQINGMRVTSGLNVIDSVRVLNGTL
jgi:hypothetical protein